MDTRFIEVAIGLVLVFALISLLASAIQELYTSASGMRGKVLRSAIESFVGDDSRFAQALLDHPLLVALSPQIQAEQAKRRPSYICGDAIVVALLGHLVDTHTAGQRPETPLQLVDAVRGALKGAGPAFAPSVGATGLAGADNILPNALFARGLSSLVMGVEHDWPAFEARITAWYNAVGDRATGWFKRKTQLGVFVIGFIVAVTFNINPIVISSRLWDDEALRKTVVEAADKAKAAYDLTQQAGDSSKSAPTQTTGSSSASAVSKLAAVPSQTDVASVQAAFNRLMAAHDNWLLAGARPDANIVKRAELLVGMSDAMQEWRKLGANPDHPLATKLVSNLAELGRAPLPAEASESARQFADALTRYLEPVPSATPSSHAAVSVPRFSRWEAVCKELNANSDADLQNLCRTVKDLNKMRSLGLPVGWTEAAYPTLFVDACPTGDKACRDGLRRLGDFVLMGLGWLIIGVACTLGASFWFDALGRLVRLRGAGTGGAREPGTAKDSTELSSKGLLTPATAQVPTVAVGTEERPPMSDALNDAERALTMPEVQRVQRGLDMPEVAVSGWFDGPTRRAIKAWQERLMLLPANGELSQWQMKELLAMRLPGRVPPAVTRPEAVPGNTNCDDEDGCDLTNADPMEDADLPPARGGVA